MNRVPAVSGALFAATLGLAVSMAQAGPAGAPGPAPSNTTRSSVALHQADLLEERASDPLACIGLAAALAEEATLDLIDPPDELTSESPVHWQLYRIVVALARNPSDSAAQEFDHLCGDPRFRSDQGRSEVLLRAMADVKTPGDQACALIRIQSEPDSVNLQVVVVALWLNRSATALALLEEILADPAQEETHVTAWMRMGFVPWRGEAPVIALAERLLKPGHLSPTRSTRLVECLYDFRPDEWYAPYKSVIHPPAPEAMQTQAKTELIILGRRLLSEHNLPPPLSETVAASIARLDSASCD